MYSQLSTVDEQHEEEARKHEEEARKHLDKLLPNQLDKQITGLLGKLQIPWFCDKNEGELEGLLYKRQRKLPHHWKLYKFVLSGNNLYYYSNQKAKKPRGIMSVSFVSAKMPTTETQLNEIKQSELSKNHFLVFSPNRMATLCAPTNEDLERFHSALEKVIRENLREDEIRQREGYVKELLPLMAQKTEHDMERILSMIAELEHTGFGQMKMRKEKSGNLEMLVEDDSTQEPTWAKYYFVLQNQCVYYYKNSKTPPKGIITLKFTLIQSGGDDSQENVIRLVTPVSTFTLRAKHKVAAEEWANALQASKAGKRKDKFSGTGDREGLLAGDEFTDLHQMSDLNVREGGDDFGFHKRVWPQLTYVLPDSGKIKTFRLPLGSTTIGRSDSCNVTIEDKKISRSHAKIEVNEHTATVLDLGSGHGTKVNHVKVDRKNLRPGDTIKVGKTRLKFEVTSKK